MTTPTRVVVYGSREDGHAKVVLETLVAMGGLVCVGCLDDVPDNRGRRLRGLAVLGGRESLPGLTASGIEGVVFGFGEGAGRRALLEPILSAGLLLPLVVHPRAVVAARVSCGEGTQILAGALLQPDCRLGRAVLVNTGAIVEHDCVLEDGVTVGPGACLTGRVRVGEEALIGAGAVVLPDLRIGSGAAIGAGAVVTRDVPAGARMAGVPARPLPARS